MSAVSNKTTSFTKYYRQVLKAFVISFFGILTSVTIALPLDKVQYNIVMTSDGYPIIWAKQNEYNFKETLASVELLQLQYCHSGADCSEEAIDKGGVYFDTKPVQTEEGVKYAIAYYTAIGELVGVHLLDSVLTEFSQYASEVLDFSTQWSTNSWSANQVLGESNTFRHGDVSTSWATSSANRDELEFVSVNFSEAVYSSGVTIRESYNNGFVVRIDTLDINGDLRTVWNGTDTSTQNEVFDFRASWELTDYVVEGVKVYINTNHTSSWEEIDSIQLHGFKVNATDDSDTVAPVLTLNGNSSITLPVNTAYIEAGATAIDDVDGNIPVVISGIVDASKVGVNILTYTATDQASNTVSKTRTVNIIPVIDTIPPVISLNGSSSIELLLGSSYVEAGATAIDDSDGNISASVIISGLVDTTTVGTYSLTYNVTDTAGNVAIQKTRIVNVTQAADTISPIITLNGNSSVSTPLNTSYDDQGATALDNRDGNISANITVTSTVDTNSEGSYSVIYTVSDAANNISTKTRTVVVIDESTSATRNTPTTEDFEVTTSSGLSVTIGSHSFIDDSSKVIYDNIEIEASLLDDSAITSISSVFGDVENNDDDPITLFGAVNLNATLNGSTVDLIAEEKAQVQIPLNSTTLADGTELEVGDELPIWGLGDDGKWQVVSTGIVIDLDATTDTAAVAAARSFGTVSQVTLSARSIGSLKNYAVSTAVQGLKTYAVGAASSYVPRNVSDPSVEADEGVVTFTGSGVSYQFVGKGNSSANCSQESSYKISTISVTGSNLGVLDTDVSLTEVKISINDTFVKGLAVKLVSPSGQSRDLMSGEGNPNNPRQGGPVTFRDDEFVSGGASYPSLDGQTNAPFTGIYNARDQLSSFNSGEAEGTWKIKVCDAGNDNPPLKPDGTPKTTNKGGSIGSVSLSFKRLLSDDYEGCSGKYPGNTDLNIPLCGENSGRWSGGVEAQGDSVFIPHENSTTNYEALFNTLKEYPEHDGVLFENGYPYLSPFRYIRNNKFADVVIENPTAGTNRVPDYRQAHAVYIGIIEDTGWPRSVGSGLNKYRPDDWIWHHHQTTGRMQLIKKVIHDIRHCGSFCNQ